MAERWGAVVSSFFFFFFYSIYVHNSDKTVKKRVQGNPSGYLIKVHNKRPDWPSNIEGVRDGGVYFVVIKTYKPYHYYFVPGPATKLSSSNEQTPLIWAEKLEPRGQTDVSNSF